MGFEHGRVRLAEERGMGFVLPQGEDAGFFAIGLFHDMPACGFVPDGLEFHMMVLQELQDRLGGDGGGPVDLVPPFIGVDRGGWRERIRMLRGRGCTGEEFGGGEG